MHATATGGPRFTASAMADPADTAWDERFCLVNPNAPITSIAVSGTDVYVGGAFTMIGPDTAYGIIKWNGTSWSLLCTDLDAPVYTIAISGTDVYIGGIFTTVNGITVNHIAKWDGSNWSALGTGMNGNVYALGAQGANVYAGGAFTVAGGVNANYVAQWDGTSWMAMGTGMDNWVMAIAVSDTVVYAGGAFIVAGGDSVYYAAQWKSGAWFPLSLGVNGTVYTLAVNGSDVYAGGAFTGYRHKLFISGPVTIVSANHIARWNIGWSALGAGTTGEVDAIAINDTNIYAGGSFGTAGGVSANSVAMWNGTTWFALDVGLGGPLPQVYALAFSGTTLYAGGSFATAGEDSARNVAKWDGTAWSPLGLGLNGPVYALAAIGSNLYAGGYFTNAGGARVNYIAKWNGTSWSSLGQGLNGGVTSLAVIGTDLYVAGGFDSAGGIRANYIAKWDGTAWSALSSGMNNVVEALATSGSDLYAGGPFVTAGGAPASQIARWDGVGWSALGTGFGAGSYVQSLLATPNGIGGTDVYVGGSFDTAGGMPANNIAEWNGGHWSALGSGMNLNVLGLCTNGSNIDACGGFYMAGGNTANHVAQWNGSSWSALGSGVSGYEASTVCIHQTDLYVGGYEIDSAGGVSVHGLAKWDGVSWSPLGSGTNDYPRAIVVWGNDLYAGGLLTRAGGRSSMYIAHWKLPPPPEPFGFAVRTGWDMVSTPMIPQDDSVTALFPGAVSNAFDYGAPGYEISGTMTPGVGYWLRFSSAGPVSVTGWMLSTDTVAVRAGWNLIGSVSSPIHVSSITSIPPGMVTGAVFGYSGSYFPADSIFPGNAYWVKVSGDGSLVLSSSGPVSPAARIRIVPTSELPPPPPEAGNSASLISRAPRQYTLEQNYPNPFNPATTIGYQLPASSRVTLQIYNLLGQVVATLANGIEDAGFKQVVWDASPVASGIYYYQLEATTIADPGRTFRSVRKMLLVR